MLRKTIGCESLINSQKSVYRGNNFSKVASLQSTDSSSTVNRLHHKFFPEHVMRCTICYHLDNLKNVKNTHRGVLILVKLQALACNFTKINTPPCVFFTFFKLCKWFQIAQRITYALKTSSLKKSIWEKSLSCISALIKLQPCCVEHAVLPKMGLTLDISEESLKILYFQESLLAGNFFSIKLQL